MAKIKFSPQAKADLADIDDYSVDQFGQDAADIYARGFNETFDVLRRHPLAGAEKPELGARSPLHRSPQAQNFLYSVRRSCADCQNHSSCPRCTTRVELNDCAGHAGAQESGEMTRTATCRCGQLSATCTGEPIRVSVCHCYDCQRRSGSAFAVQARFPADAVTISGDHNVYEHVADSGNAASFHFCPTCGSTLWYHARPHRELFAIPVGNFADKDFPAPHYSVWENRKHHWLNIAGDDIEHYD